MRSVPVSAVIATKDRAGTLKRMLDSLREGAVVPCEVIVVDGSEGADTEAALKDFAGLVDSVCSVRRIRAESLGAAVQRNQGVALATQPFVWFVDDDVIFEPGCLLRLFGAISDDSALGGVNAMITNQRYSSPGRVSRLLFSVLNGENLPSFAGRVIGPAINLLPSDEEHLPEVVNVEWLNTTCTIYRRDALPSPPFDSLFTGYSLMEDLTLSLRVGKSRPLANVRTARIFHDSQPGSHKADIEELAAMELINRHYVMTEVLKRSRVMDHAKLALWEVFQMSVCAMRRQTRGEFAPMWRGKLRALKQIVSGHKIDKKRPLKKSHQPTREDAGINI